MASVVPEERKLVTILFADLAGSTELATGRDPEQLRSLLAAFFEEMAQQIQAFGGTVEKYAGDAIMAVFGVPQVHEDDPERAVRAAMAMQQGLAQLGPVFAQEYSVALELRIGIATGEAVAAAGPAREFMVTGEVANLAARLQSAASGVVVSEETHRLLEALLEAEALPPLTLKGFTAPVRAFRVTGLRALEGRARGGTGLSSPVVGRERELDALRRCADDLVRGRGQIVLIVGEAGLGKSRLKIELREHPPAGVRWLEGRCYAYTQGTSYAPLIQVLRAVLGMSGSEPPALARTRLRAGLRSLMDARGDPHRAVLGQMLGVEAEPGAAPVDPRALQTQLVLALRAVAEALAGRGPVILAIEDLHWADSATIEALTLLTEVTDLLPLMILVTTRPEAENAAWDLRFHVQRNFPHRLTELALQPLGAADSDRLVANLLHVASLPEALRQRVLDLAEGNPFFVEEILRSLIEQGTLRRDGERWTAAGDADRLGLPTTLRGVIGARIDRLPPPVKATLQRAAVVGRLFGHGALRALSGEPARGDLDRSLAQLLRAELIREWARLPEREYIFKHALTQDAAYAGILLAERRTMHRHLAEHLEGNPTGTAGDQAAVLARHWLGAEEWERALHWTLLAAERARKLYARPEAKAHYWQALELLDRLPRTFERRRLLADATFTLSRLPGWTRPEGGLAEGLGRLEAAAAAARETDDQATLARLEAVMAIYHHDDAVFDRSLERARAAGEPLVEAFVAWQYAESLGQRGRYQEALALIGAAIETWGNEGARYDQAMTMAMTGRCHSSRAGRMEDALGYAARARRITEELDDARLRAWVGMEAEPYMYMGRWEDAVRVAEAGLAASWEIGEWTPIFFESAWGGIASLKLGRVDDARRMLERAAGEQARAPSPFQIIYLHIALTQLYLATGEAERALAMARRAIDLADASGFRLEQGAARRALGQVHEAAGRLPEATAAYRESLDILEDIQSRPELGQTLLAYGRCLLRGDAPRGRALIERALRLFEEMGATGWVAEAREALSARPS